MVLTTRTHTTLFASLAASTATTTHSSDTKTLIRLPLSVVPHYEQRCEVTGAIVPAANKPLFRTNLWSSDEHERFLHGLEMFPNGPWKEVAKIVGTKTTRQTMTHAQKYRQKIERRMVAKPRALSKKQQRRISLAATRSHLATGVAGFQSMLSEDDALLAEALATFGPGPEDAVTSPTEVCGDAFDVSFLDQEFEAMLQSLEVPLPSSSEHSAMYASPYAHQLGVFSV